MTSSETAVRRHVLHGVLALIFIGVMLAMLALAWPKLYGIKLGGTFFLTAIVIWRLARDGASEFRQAIRIELERQGGG